MVSRAQADIRVMKTLVEHDTPVTPTVLNAVWSWFMDVELHLPIPVMDLEPKSRKLFATQILTDMDEAFTRLATRIHNEPEQNMEIFPEVAEVNALWRELAGVYAPLLNTLITTLSDEEKAEVYPNAVEMIAASSGMDVDETRERIQNDPVMRTMLRRSGLDPDTILQYHN